MKKELAMWMAHIEAIKREGVSTGSYAKQHNIPVKRLYYWQRKARLATGATSAAAVQSNAFVAVRVAEPAATVATGCVLVLASGMRLEMPALPAPAWLAAFARSAQGAL